MIFVTLTREKDESFTINRWKKEPKHQLARTHEASTVSCPSAGEVAMFYGTPPDTLRIK